MNVLEYLFRGIADKKSCNTGAAYRAHDDQVNVLLCRNPADEDAGIAFELMDMGGDSIHILGVQKFFQPLFVHLPQIFYHAVHGIFGKFLPGSQRSFQGRRQQ